MTVDRNGTEATNSGPPPAPCPSEPSKSLTSDQSELILILHDINALKFGSFTLKSGITSPVYIDLRVSVSHPQVLSKIADSLLSSASTIGYDCLCGVPYTALPFATAMSLKSKTPMVMRRKEAKAYGTKQMVEGTWEKQQKCLIVEDLVTSGLSVMETVEILKTVGLNVSDVSVLLDRQQGARDNLKEHGLNLHAAFTMTQMMDVLVEAKRVETSVRDSVLSFVRENQVKRKVESSAGEPEAKKSNGKENGTEASPILTYSQRSEKVRNPVAQRLLQLMDSKKTNLAVAADVTTVSELCEIAEQVGPYICLLKTHADIVVDWSEASGHTLSAIAKRHNFLIFEDRKFADIGNTVLHQATGGVHKILSWADIINAHSVPGPGIIKGLQKASEENVERSSALLLLAEMSSEGNMPTAIPKYKEKTIEMAKAAENENNAFVCGFISMGKIAGDEFVYMTPGVQLATSGDGLGQQYRSPEMVIGEKGSDVIIVGRGIYKAQDRVAAAKKYRDAGWRAYQKRSSGVK